MRYIYWLPDIDLVAVDGSPFVDSNGEPMTASHKKFLLSRLHDQVFATDMEAVLSQEQLKHAINAWEPDGGRVPLAIESADHKRLEQSVRKPKDGYKPAAAHNLVGYMRSVTEAETRPRKEAEEQPQQQPDN